MKSLYIYCLLPALATLSFGQAPSEASSAVAVEQTLMQLERDWSQASLKKDIDTLNVTRVSGSSLTSGGFKIAIAAIKEQALES